MKSTVGPSALLIFICLTGLVPIFGLSVLQTPEKINTTEDAINCHIEDSLSGRIIVIWLKNNLTNISSETFNTSKHQLSSGNVSINATLHLTSVHLNHTGTYYCKVTRDKPRLDTVYGNGTHVYIVKSSTIVATPSPANSPEDTMMTSSLSGLGIFLLIICIALVIYIYYKRQYRNDRRTKEAPVDAANGSQRPVSPENVVYAALNIPKKQDSMKTRNENSAALVSATVSCAEESVTYSEVHIKREPKDEG